MADSNYLFNDLLNLTKQSARFRRVVLHLHSPQSYDFGDTPDSDSKLNNKDQYIEIGGEKLFIDHFGNSVDLIAITDHMKSEYACRLSKWTKDNNHHIAFLPGIELNIRLQPPLDQLRLHILVIFPENKTLGEIERIIPNGAIPSDENRTGKEEISNIDLKEFINKIQEDHQGICIAAHADAKNGIRMLFRQTGQETISLFNPDGKLSKEDERQISESFKGFLADIEFDGIEITRPKDRAHYSWKTESEHKVTHHVPVFLTYDAHNIETIKALETDKKDRITFVKMADVSWRGLKTAIQFPHTRIRFSDDRVPPPFILGMQIISTSGEGFFSDLKLGFAENLNCLIGARGSGKSTIIDSIRYVFGYNRTLNELGSPDLKKAVIDRQKATLKDSIIKVLYQVNETETHLLEATYGGEKSEYVTKVYDLQGNPIHVEDVEKSDKYPLRLFGWSEIETLGRDPERQMDLLDKLVEGIKKIIDNKIYLQSKLRENSLAVLAQAQKLVEQYHYNNEEITRYQEYKQEFERYNTQEVENLFKNLDLINDRKSLLDEFLQVIKRFQENMRESSSVNFEETLQDDFDRSPTLKVWWDSIKDSELHVSKSQETITKNLDIIHQSLNNLRDSAEDLHNALQTELEILNEQIRTKVSVDPRQQVLADLRSQSKERLNKIEELREKYLENFNIFSKLLTDRDKIIEGLVEQHTAITQLRQEKNNDIEQKLNEFQTEETKVEIRLTQDGNKADFEDTLRNLAALKDAHRNFKAKKWPEIIAQSMVPVQFARNIRQNNPTKFTLSREIDGATYSISAEEADEICSNLNPLREDSSALITEIDLDKLKSLLEVEEVEWDDKVNILRNGQPVENASPGQRSSAMLPLIALAETVPLIIDQPEDNLDNRLVGKVLVDILAKLKEKRQIIVCTHNPNIVVLGDAEQVIVMEAIDNNHGRTEEIQASIDHPTIIQKVIELMEGGMDAFETRKKRYGR